MNMKKLKLSIILLMTFGYSFNVIAGNEDRAGEAGASQLLINPWTKSVGWGGANTASVTGLEAMSLNINTANSQKPAYQFLSDFVKAAELEVILIVNMKLGCLNHALLTYETIKTDDLHCIAWIANCAASEPMANLTENITELEQLLPMPKIAQFDYFNDVDSQGNKLSFHEKINLAAQQINLVPLLK